MYKLIQRIYWALKGGISINATVGASMIKRWWWTDPTSNGFKQANVFLVGDATRLLMTMYTGVDEFKSPKDLLLNIFTDMYGPPGDQWAVSEMHKGSPVMVVFTHDDYWQIMMKLTDDTSWVFNPSVDTELWFDYSSNWKRQVTCFQFTDECTGKFENMMRE